MLRQTGGMERALFPCGKEEGKVQWDAAFGKRIWQGTCKKDFTYTPLPQTGQKKHGLAQDNKNLAGESTPLLDSLTSSPELLELRILRNWKTFAGNSCLAVTGSSEVFVYGQY